MSFRKYLELQGYESKFIEKVIDCFHEWADSTRVVMHDATIATEPQPSEIVTEIACRYCWITKKVFDAYHVL